MGGMGSVFLAEHPRLGSRVAIKVLRPELATAQGVERFTSEARILAQLSPHPHIVPVHDVGESDGLFFYVMDYLEGETVADRLVRGPLAAREALKLGRDLLHALETAHDHGVVHRDVKPGTTVRFINVTGGPHNIAFYADSVPKGAAEALKKGMANAMGDLTGPFLTQPNEHYDVSFAGAPAGTYRGFCLPHVALGMHITIKVQ